VNSRLPNTIIRPSEVTNTSKQLSEHGQIGQTSRTVATQQISTGSKKINNASISNNPGQQTLWKKWTAVYDGTVMNVHVPNVLSGTRWSSSL